jgi:hypothetical protein
MPDTWKVEVLLETSLEEAERLISPTTAMLQQVPGGVLMNTYTQTLEWMAHFLVSLRCPLIVREPPELRDALRAVAAEVMHLSERRE